MENRTAEITPVKKKPTLKDIARLCNCSTGTVSLALADSSLVNDTTRAQIILTALELGYDLSKRQISVSRQKNYSLVVNNSTYLNTFFWSEVVQAIEVALAKQHIGLNLVRFDSSTDDADDFLIEMVDKKSSGLIVLAECDRHRIDILSKLGLPVLVVDGNNYCGTQVDCVCSSDYFSSYGAADYLYEKGHRRLGFVGAVHLSMSFRQRRDGFRTCALSKPDVRYTETLENEESGNPNVNREKLIEMMSRDDRPTALMCANDFTAFGVCDVLADMGLQVPRDVSIVGYDNITYDHPMAKRLTTFDNLRSGLGQAAIDLLTERIKHPKGPKKSVAVFASLVERESVLDLKTPSE